MSLNYNGLNVHTAQTFWAPTSGLGLLYKFDCIKYEADNSDISAGWSKKQGFP